MDFGPSTGLTVLVECLVPSRPNKISFSISWVNGCYFVANRLEVLVDEDDSRSSSQVREHESFLLVSQLHVAIQTL